MENIRCYYDLSPDEAQDMAALWSSHGFGVRAWALSNGNYNLDIFGPAGEKPLPWGLSAREVDQIVPRGITEGL